VGKPQIVATEVTFDATHTIGRIVSLKWNPKYNALFVAAGDDADRAADQQRAEALGNAVVNFPPKQSYHIGASVAAVYSFVRNPTYSVSTTNGALTIAETANDYNKVTGAVAINITPDTVFNQFAQPHAELGIVPDSAKFGVFAGIGFTFLSSANAATSTQSANGASASKASGSNSMFQGLEFNLGVMYQKINELAPGLSVGQTVATTQALKVNSIYKTGLYLGFGVKVK
jgi:hypothetical protein